MKPQKFLSLVLIVLAMGLVLSCSVSPQPISYGSDGCHFCSMTIVDRQHAAELVTKKGKVYKFDAVECMLNHLKEIDATKMSLYLVNDYDAPGALIDARKANYLICEEIPSPMGEYLTAFGSEEGLEKKYKELGGQIFSWDEIRDEFKVNY